MTNDDPEKPDLKPRLDLDQCGSLLGSFIGALAMVTSPEVLREAAETIINDEGIWAFVANVQARQSEILTDIQKQRLSKPC